MTNTCAASDGSPSAPVTMGRAADVSQASAPRRSMRKRSALPIRNSGTASPRYHRTRSTVFVSRLRSRGRRIGAAFTGPDGSRIFVDPKSYTLLKGTVLDYDTTLLSLVFE